MMTGEAAMMTGRQALMPLGEGIFRRKMWENRVLEHGWAPRRPIKSTGMSIVGGNSSGLGRIQSASLHVSLLTSTPTGRLGACGPLAKCPPPTHACESLAGGLWCEQKQLVQRTGCVCFILQSPASAVVAAARTFTDGHCERK